MPLFRKRSQEDEAIPPPPLDTGWCRRLGIVGDALDSTSEPFCDLAVVFDGTSESGSTVIIALGHIASLYTSGYSPMMFRLDASAAASGIENRSLGGTPGPTSSAPTFGPWGTRLRGVGHILDVVEPGMRSPTVLDLDEGVVVNALLPSPKIHPPWLLYTLEYSNKQIKNAFNAAVTSTTQAHPAGRVR